MQREPKFVVAIRQIVLFLQGIDIQVSTPRSQLCTHKSQCLIAQTIFRRSSKCEMMTGRNVRRRRRWATLLFLPLLSSSLSRQGHRRENVISDSFHVGIHADGETDGQAARQIAGRIVRLSQRLFPFLEGCG